MSSDPHEVHHHKPRHLAEKMESIIPVIMLIAIAILAVGLIYGLINGGTPSYLK